MKETFFKLCGLLAISIALSTTVLRAQQSVQADFRFEIGDDMYRPAYRHNAATMRQLYDFIDNHRETIVSGVATVRVRGYCATEGDVPLRLSRAKIRSNRIKSELIVHKGLTEDNFKTSNSSHSNEGNADIVIVSITLPETNETELPAQPLGQAGQGELPAQPLAQAEQQAQAEPTEQAAQPLTQSGQEEQPAQPIKTAQAEPQASTEPTKQPAQPLKQSEQEEQSEQSEQPAQPLTQAGQEEQAEQSEQGEQPAQAEQPTQPEQSADGSVAGGAQQPLTDSAAPKSNAVAAVAPFGARLSLRTNLLYWAGGTPNVGVEWKASQTIGLALGGGYAPWASNSWSHNWAGWFVAPEAKFYFGEAQRWFAGVEFLAGGFNLKPADKGYMGHIVGGGVTGGYLLPLSSCLALDFSIGFGYGHFEYDTYRRADNGVNVYTERGIVKNAPIPVQAGVSLIWKIQ